MRALPRSTYDGDIHCVTTWSKLGTSFAGVSVDDLFADVGVRPEATHVVAWSVTGYTTNLPIEHVTRRQGVDRLGARGQAAAAGARRPGPDARAAPLLLEERQVDRRHPACSTTTSRASGRCAATTSSATRGWSRGTTVTDGLPPHPVAPSPEGLPPLPRCPRWGACRRCPPSAPSPAGCRRAARAGSGSWARSSRSATRPPRATTLRLWLPRVTRTCRASTTSCASRDDGGADAALVQHRVGARGRARRAGPGTHIELTVERLDDGVRVAVSCTTRSRVGDRLEVRGPFGGWFIWRGDTPGCPGRAVAPGWCR